MEERSFASFLPVACAFARGKTIAYSLPESFIRDDTQRCVLSDLLRKRGGAREDRGRGRGVVGRRHR